nr:peptidase M4 [Verrucomicrobiota bacterium]
PLEPGPAGRVFEVDDFDGAQGTHWGRVDLENRGILLRNGRDPSTSDPLFHQQMVYAVCATVYAAFRRALGRHLSWGFELHAAAGSRSAARLRIRPHAFVDRNAYYDRDAGELCFGYFRAPEKVASRTPPGGVVFTCLSHDIIAHEVTHALLDGLRAHFSTPSGPDVPGFHEGFADLVATFQHFSYREVVQAAIRRSEGKVERATLLTGIAHQFGSTLGSTKPLRTAFESPAEAGFEPRRYSSSLEAHEMGEVLVQAVFEAALTVFRRKTAQYVRLATEGTGRLPAGELPVELQNIFGETASKLASQFLSICIRAIDYCPPVDIELGEYLRALITADHDLVPDDRWGYREALIDAFRVRGIYPPQVNSLAEDSLRWAPAELSVKCIPELNFAHLQFEGDPASPASADELRRQARALGAILGSAHNLDQFGLVRPGAPALQGDAVARPCVHSIRSSRRVGPDGQIIFDLVAEVTQRRTVRAPEGAFDVYGGATVIIGPRGEVRYVIAKNILNENRVAQQRDFINGAGRRFWESRNGATTPVRNPFKLLHEPINEKPAGRRRKPKAKPAGGT